MMQLKISLLILRVMSVILHGILLHFTQCKDQKVIDNYVNLIKTTIKSIKEVEDKHDRENKN